MRKTGKQLLTMKKKERRKKHEHHIIYGDTRVRIEAEELPCPYSRKMLETIPASRCFVRNEETDKTSMADFLKKCGLTVCQREWHFENGVPACTLSVDVEW